MVNYNDDRQKAWSCVQGKCGVNYKDDRLKVWTKEQSWDYLKEEDFRNKYKYNFYVFLSAFNYF